MAISAFSHNKHTFAQLASNPETPRTMLKIPPKVIVNQVKRGDASTAPLGMLASNCCKDLLRTTSRWGYNPTAPAEFWSNSFSSVFRIGTYDACAEKQSPTHTNPSQSCFALPQPNAAEDASYLTTLPSPDTQAPPHTHTHPCISVKNNQKKPPHKLSHASSFSCSLAQSRSVPCPVPAARNAERSTVRCVFTRCKINVSRKKRSIVLLFCSENIKTAI